MPRRLPLPAASAEGPDPLGALIDRAVAGDVNPLYAFLTRHSGLPGKVVNANIVAAFASHAASRGRRADELVTTMLHLHPDRAPGGTALEILPVAAVAAVGARCASDAAAVAKLLGELEAAAEDLRYRVRDEVPRALARIGAGRGELLLAEVSGWMDGFFQAAAVLVAASERGWLSTLHDAPLVVERIDQAFDLACGADRADERYPGYKALVVALETTPAVFAARFGAPIFDALVRWSTVKEPMLREAIRASVTGDRVGKRFADDVLRVKRALDESAPTRRDPRTDVGRTRGRGKKRGR